MISKRIQQSHEFFRTEGDIVLAVESFKKKTKESFVKVIEPLMSSVRENNFEFRTSSLIATEDKKENYERAIDFVFDIIEELVEFTRHQENVQDLSFFLSTLRVRRPLLFRQLLFA